MLRMALSSQEDHIRWFVKMESFLFKVQQERLDNEEKEQLISSVSLENNLKESEKFSSYLGGRVVCLPFELVPHLVGSRE